VSGGGASHERPDLLDAALAEIEECGLSGWSRARVARRAGTTLAEVYRNFPTRTAVLARLGERLDRAMLAGDVAELAELTPRERLFELIMRRLDALRPYRGAMRRLSREACFEPRLVIRSLLNLDRLCEWLLELADVPPRGCLRLALEPLLMAVYLRTYRVWLADESADQARTLAALDRELARFERLCGWLCCPSRRRTRPAAPEGEPASA